MRSDRLVLAFLFVVAPTISAAAAVVRVPSDFPTIQAALTAAASGDSVIVDPGVYFEDVDFEGKDVALRSTGGADATTIAGSGDRTVTIGPGGEIEGFTITHEFASPGRGMGVRGSGSRIADNIIEGNTSYVAGILGDAASPLVERNLFRNNTCDNQFGTGVLSFVNSSSPRIINNILEDNDCRAINLRLPAGNAPEVINNTIVRNPTGIRVSRLVDASTQIYRNNIIVNNEIGLEVDFGDAAYNPIWENNLVFDNTINYEDTIGDLTGTAGNISADPLFVGAPCSDYRLEPASPAIDAGTGLLAPVGDFNQDVRPVDGNGDLVAVTDIGAYEFVSAVPVDLYRADMATISPVSPPFTTIFPFSLGNPLTPIVKNDFTPGTTDPDFGILSRPSVELALYQVLTLCGDILLVKDTVNDTVTVW